MHGRDFYAELSRLGLRHYEVAAELRIHPSRLSRLLREREPIPSVLSSRLLEVIERERGRRVASP
jgi:plasmid maintenance system antidote protein VapI